MITVEQQWTPCEIEFLLHCYVSPEEHPKVGAGAYKDAIHKFCQLGLIRPALEHTASHKVFEVTELGTALVKSWCAVQIPTKVYVNSQGEILQ